MLVRKQRKTRASPGIRPRVGHAGPSGTGEPNNAKNDITESESMLIGRDFGVTTDIETGPNGDLFVVSISNGAIYEISRAR